MSSMDFLWILLVCLVITVIFMCICVCLHFIGNSIEGDE